MDNKAEILLPEGVWSKREPVKEMTVFSDRYDLTVSLLLYPDDASNKWVQDEDEPEPFDSFDKFMDFDRRMNG